MLSRKLVFKNGWIVLISDRVHVIEVHSTGFMIQYQWDGTMDELETCLRWNDLPRNGLNNYPPVVAIKEDRNKDKRMEEKYAKG